MPQRITPEQYQRSRANGWTDDDLVKMGYELPSSAAPRVRPGLPAAAPVDATGPRAGGGGLHPVADIARMAAQGASMGWADEGVAALRALSPNTTYAEAAVDEQRKVDEARQKLGGLATVAELAGGIAVPGLGVGALASKIPVATRGAQLAKQFGTAVASGALTGAAGGAGSARAGEKLHGMGTGAGVGALFGAMVGAGGPIARQVGRYLGAKNATTATEKASDALLEAADRQGQDLATDADVQRYAMGLRQPGVAGKRVMDSSREMRELGVDAARANKDVEREFEQLAIAREAEQNPAIAGRVREALDVPNISAKRAQGSTTALLKGRENTLYKQLFQQFSQPIQTPEMVTAWQDVADEMPKYIDAIRKNARLSQQSVNDLMDVTGSAPTLEGAHRVKSAMARVLKALKKKEAAGTLGEDEAQALFALGNFQSRFTDAIKAAPGGKEYGMIQEIGRQGRAVREALRTGETVMQEDPDVIRQMVVTLGSKRGGAQAQQALRQGAGSAATRELADMTQGADAALNKYARNIGTQERISSLAPSQQRGDQFRRDMQDLVDMAETNKLQQSKSTSQKEILKGSRARSTALAFGEAGGIGSLLTGGDMTSPIRLAGGALLAKMFEGGRAGATEQAASQLANLLRKGSNDPDVPLVFYDMAMALQRLQRGRIVRQAGAAALSPLFLSTTDR